jgi:hypothetical protein
MPAKPPKRTRRTKRADDKERERRVPVAKPGLRVQRAIISRAATRPERPSSRAIAPTDTAVVRRVQRPPRTRAATRPTTRTLSAGAKRVTGRARR